jgi:hypothetical protein
LTINKAHKSNVTATVFRQSYIGRLASFMAADLGMIGLITAGSERLPD